MSTRESILAAAQRQLNAAPTSTLAQIADAAGVGRATIHRHFASRDALLHELGMRSIARWGQTLDLVEADAVALTGDAPKILRCLHDLLRHYLEECDEYGFALVDPYLTTSPDLADASAGLAARERRLFEAAQRRGVLRADMTSTWLGHAVYGLLVGAREAILAGTVARRDLDDLVVRTFLSGAGRASGECV